MGALAFPGVLWARIPHGRLTKIVATVAVGTVLAAGSSLVPNPVSGGSTPPPAGTANLWIDQNGGTCTRSATAVAYSDAAACTRDAVETAWQRGDTVLVKGGTTYTGKWTIDWNASISGSSCDPYGEWGTATTSQCVKVEPAPGETVNFDGAVQIETGGLWFNGTRSGTWPSLSPTYNWNITGFVSVENNIGSSAIPDNVVINGVSSSSLETLGTNNVMFRQSASGGRVCNSETSFISATTGLGINADEPKISNRSGVTVTNVVYDGVYFHDVYRNDGGANDPNGACHDGGLFIVNGNGITLRNSVWSQNWVYNIQIQAFSGTAPTNVTIENNWFGCGVEAGNITTNPSGVTQCNGQAAIQLDDLPAVNYLVRYNSSRDTLFSCFTGGPCSYTNFRLIGNVGSKPPASGSNQPCAAGAGVTAAYNVWEGGACNGSATDQSTATVTALFVDPSAGSDNYHLASGSSTPNNLVAVGTGDYAITADIDGTARPVDANRDAGSDEQ